MRNFFKSITFVFITAALLYYLAFFLFVMLGEKVHQLDLAREEELASITGQQETMRRIDFKKYERFKDEILRKITGKK